MISRDKRCFLISNEVLGRELAKELQERLGVVATSKFSCLGYAVIYVDRTAYRRAVQVGTKILIYKKVRSCGWFDYYNTVQSMNIGLIMRGVLPREHKISGDWDVGASSDIEKFRTELMKFLGKDVYVIGNDTDNTIEVHVEGLLEHREIKRNTKEFLKSHDTPFEKVMFFNEVGKPI